MPSNYRKALTEEDEDVVGYEFVPSARVERFERRIIKALTSQGSLPISRLIDFYRVSRPRSGGFEKFNRALTALVETHEIVVVGETGTPVYALG